MMKRYSREVAAAVVLSLVLLILAFAAPGFFTIQNIVDLLLNNAGTMVAALGMTLVLIAGQIDISIASQFAIVITLATMIALRDAQRWYTQGAWIHGLPENFQWFGLGQSSGAGVILGITAFLLVAVSWSLTQLSSGRRLFATGSNPEAARLAGFSTDAILTGVFVLMGALTAIAAILNAVRFSDIPGNPGTGLELKAIAAAVVGGASITGGRATVLGTLLGVLLLGAIGTALTYLGINPYWEKAVQGAIILAAAVSEYAGSRRSLAGAHAA